MEKYRIVKDRSMEDIYTDTTNMAVIIDRFNDMNEVLTDLSEVPYPSSTPEQRERLVELINCIWAQMEEIGEIIMKVGVQYLRDIGLPVPPKATEFCSIEDAKRDVREGGGGDE